MKICREDYEGSLLTKYAAEALTAFDFMTKKGYFLSEGFYNFIAHLDNQSIPEFYNFLRMILNLS